MMLEKNINAKDAENMDLKELHRTYTGEKSIQNHPETGSGSETEKGEKGRVEHTETV